MRATLILAAGLIALVLLTWFCAYPKVAPASKPEPAATLPRAGGDAAGAPADRPIPAPVQAPAEAPAERVVTSIRNIIAGRPIEFEIASARLAPGGRALLDELVGPIQAEPSARFEVDGYTDSSGDPDFNRDLSRQRAEAVRAYLIERGVDGSRIEARGHGAEQPIADNATAEGRLRNRRVEFTALP